MISTNKTNFNSFDIAKFICSIFVVMIHVAPFGTQESANIFSCLNLVFRHGICRVAVPLFFVLSGFFLYRKTSLGNFSFKPTKKYFAHILKLYIIWSLIYFPLNVLSILREPTGIAHGLYLYLKNVVFIGSYQHLWYLNSLLCAVLIVSFLLYKKCSFKKIFYTSSILYFFGLFGDAYYEIITPLFDVPYIGKILNLYFMIFDTTRNGLFFGFFFVSMGMILSAKEITFGRRTSLCFLITSIIMMCIESSILHALDIRKDSNILLFAPPSAYFAFAFFKTLEFKDNKIYKNLRTMSSLIFYSHLWIYCIVEKMISLFGYNLNNTPIPFVITLTSSIIFSFVIVKLSDTKPFGWLKKIY